MSVPGCRRYLWLGHDISVWETLTCCNIVITVIGCVSSVCVRVCVCILLQLTSDSDSPVLEMSFSVLATRSIPGSNGLRQEPQGRALKPGA